MHIKDHNDAMTFFKTYDSVASKGKWKEFIDEMEFDSMLQEPRTMAQEPRMGLDDGGRIAFGDGLIVTDEIKALFPEGDFNKHKYGFPKKHSSYEKVRSKTRTEERALYNQRAEVKEARRNIQNKAYAKDPKRFYQSHRKYVTQPHVAEKLAKKQQTIYYSGGKREKDLARLKGITISKNLGAYLQSPDNVLIKDMIRAAKTDSNLNIIRGGADNTVVAVQEGEKIYHAVGSNRKPVPGSPKNSISIIKHPGFKKRAEFVKQQKEFKNTKVAGKDITYGEALDVLESKKAGTPVTKKNPAEYEHVKEVATDYKKGQIALRTANREKQVIMSALKNGHITKAEAGRQLKKIGVRAFIDGKYIGAPKINPEKQFKDLKKYVDRKINVDKNLIKKIDKDLINKNLIKLGCGMYAGGRVGFKVGSGQCITKAVAKLKSGNLSAAEKKIVDAMGDGLKKGGVPKKFWTTALKGEGYFALADFANNLTKGQGLDKAFSNALEMATFGALDIGGNERDLMRYAKERGLDTKDMKEWMDYAQTYGKYAKTYEDLDWATQQTQEDVISADDVMNYVSTIEGAPGKIKNLEEQLEEKGKSKTIQSGKGYKDMNEMIEGVVAKEWNKPAGTVLDRGLRKMLGMKGDEGLVWGPIGALTREGIESLGFDEHDALKGFTPQTVMNYHPAYGYKEDIKDVIREGDSPMEDMLMFMEKNFPSTALRDEALRTKIENLKEKEQWVDTGWGRKKKKVKKDMGTYDYDPNLAEGGIASLNVKK
jgi:hypothetical protein